MNKKQMIKEQKRIKKEQKQVSKLFNDDKEIYNVFKIALGVILFLALTYLLINIIKGNFNIFNKRNLQTEEIDSTMVMIGTMFNKKSDEEYLVLAYDMSDNDTSSYYNALIDKYVGNMDIYKLDLSSGFNSAFIDSKTVVSDDLTKLKLSGPTLLIIKNDKIISSYIKEEDITKYLSDENR